MSLVPFMLIEEVRTDESAKYPVLCGEGNGLHGCRGRCTLLPDCVELTMKDVRPLSDRRFAVSVKGAAIARLSENASIAALPALPWFSKRFFLHIGEQQIPRGVCVLTSPLFGRRRYAGRLDRVSGLPCFLVSAGQRIPVAPGFPVRLETARGTRIVNGTVLASIPEKSGEKGKRGGDRLVSCLREGEALSLKSVLRAAFSLQGYAVWKAGDDGSAYEVRTAGADITFGALRTAGAWLPGNTGETAEGEIRSFPLEGGVLCSVSPRFLADCARSLERWSIKPGGTRVVAAATESGIPPAVLRGILRCFEQTGRNVEGNGESERRFSCAARLSGDLILPAAANAHAYLSPVGKGILVSLERAGTGGGAAAAFRKPPFDREMGNLERLRLVERRGGFYFLPAALAEAEAVIQAMRAEGKTVDPPAAAEVLSVSRARASAILRGMTDGRGGITE